MVVHKIESCSERRFGGVCATLSRCVLLLNLSYNTSVTLFACLRLQISVLMFLDPGFLTLFLCALIFLFYIEDVYNSGRDKRWIK